MMSTSLKSAVQQPVYTKDSILQGLRTPQGRRLIWVVVEDHEDKLFYEKFANEKTSNIKTSEDESGRRGCDNVEEIVTAIQERGYKNVIGIRDADYLRYRAQQVSISGVFSTDARDLEMMLLDAPSVVQGMGREIIGFKSDIDYCKSICKEIGYMRVMNDVCDMGCRFQAKVKISKIWDHVNHTLLPNWKDIYTNMVLDNLKDGVQINIADIDSFVVTRSLSEEPYAYICRGHDVLRLFHYKRKNSHNCESRVVVQKMIQKYSFTDFSSTVLFRDTDAYVKSIDYTLWKSE